MVTSSALGFLGNRQVSDQDVLLNCASNAAAQGFSLASESVVQQDQ